MLRPSGKIVIANTDQELYTYNVRVFLCHVNSVIHIWTRNCIQRPVQITLSRKNNKLNLIIIKILSLKCNTYFIIHLND